MPATQLAVRIFFDELFVVERALVLCIEGVCKGGCAFDMSKRSDGWAQENVALYYAAHALYYGYVIDSLIYKRRQINYVAALSLFHLCCSFYREGYNFKKRGRVTLIFIGF